jgi:hypothetical protein
MSTEETPGSGGMGEVILYKTEDGTTRLDVRMDGQTAWLTQAQMAELFQTSVPNINIHLRNLFDEGELRKEAVIKDHLITAADGKRYRTQHYNLDVIISVGYRVKSVRGTQFRIWATERLREYLVKGFTLDDQRLKQAGGGDYFDELLRRIRDIRSSEKNFYKKVLEIYATSVDYDKDADVSQEFFATVQNKMHWAAHGHTAAEIVHGRADANQPNMGLTSTPGPRVCKADTGIAKNYLNEKELEALNLIVSLYLDFAELQALSRKPMTMAQWIAKLDGFLTLSDRDILKGAGKISHDSALAKAHAEYEKFRVIEANKPSQVETDFDEAVRRVKRIESKPSTPKPKPKKPKPDGGEK